MPNKHAVILGRRGGRVGGKSKSMAKIRAARRNGKLGGRPKKNVLDAPYSAPVLVARSDCGADT